MLKGAATLQCPLSNPGVSVCLRTSALRQPSSRKAWDGRQRKVTYAPRARTTPRKITRITEQVRLAYEALMGLDGREACSESQSAVILSALPQQLWQGVAVLDSRMRRSRNLPATMETAGEENTEAQKAGRTCTSSLGRLLLFR